MMKSLAGLRHPLHRGGSCGGAGDRPVYLLPGGQVRQDYRQLCQDVGLRAGPRRRRAYQGRHQDPF